MGSSGKVRAAPASYSPHTPLPLLAGALPRTPPPVPHCLPQRGVHVILDSHSLPLTISAPGSQFRAPPNAGALAVSSVSTSSTAAILPETQWRQLCPHPWIHAPYIHGSRKCPFSPLNIPYRFIPPLSHLRPERPTLHGLSLESPLCKRPQLYDSILPLSGKTLALGEPRYHGLLLLHHAEHSWRKITKLCPFVSPFDYTGLFCLDLVSHLCQDGATSSPGSQPPPSTPSAGLPLTPGLQAWSPPFPITHMSGTTSFPSSPWFSGQDVPFPLF